VLPLLIADDCGPRVSELVDAQVGDLDEAPPGDPATPKRSPSRARPATSSPPLFTKPVPVEDDCPRLPGLVIYSYIGI
jgi:hypothetical protein